MKKLLKKITDCKIKSMNEKIKKLQSIDQYRNYGEYAAGYHKFE